MSVISRNTHSCDLGKHSLAHSVTGTYLHAFLLRSKMFAFYALKTTPFPFLFSRHAEHSFPPISLPVEMLYFCSFPKYDHYSVIFHKSQASSQQIRTIMFTCKKRWLLPGARYRLVARKTHPHTSTPRDGWVCSKEGDARNRTPPGYSTRYHCSTNCRNQHTVRSGT